MCVKTKSALTLRSVRKVTNTVTWWWVGLVPLSVTPFTKPSNVGKLWWTPNGVPTLATFYRKVIRSPLDWDPIR